MTLRIVISSQDGELFRDGPDRGPVFGVLLATTILKEQLSPLALLGAGIVLASTVLIMRYDTASS